MLRTSSFVVLIATVMLASVGFSDAQAQRKGTKIDKNKKIYCWDDGGTRVCGDALPAEAAEAAREEINARTGMTTRQLDRALTAEERKAMEARKAVEAAQEEQQEERARRAQAMVSSYDNVQAIEAGYEQRITLANVTMNSTQEGIKQTRPHLVRLLQAAGDMELAGKKVPANRAKEILKVRADILAMQKQLQSQKDEIAQIKSERDEAISLYLEFKQENPEPGDNASN